MENHADHLVNDYDHKKDYKWIRQMYFGSAHSKIGIPQIEEAIITHFLEELEMRKIHVEDPNLE